MFASGLSNANSTLTQISNALMGVSVVTVTIAILIVGYKVLFGGQTIQECGKIIIGAVIIASASSLASLLVGNMS